MSIYDPVAGGAALVVLDVSASALAVFKDWATGEPRLACAADGKVFIFDPVAGGEALLVIDVGSSVTALALFVDKTGALRLACGTGKYDSKTFSHIGCDVRIYDPVAGGDALLVIDVGNKVSALEVFKTWRRYFASGAKSAQRSVRTHA